MLRRSRAALQNLTFSLKSEQFNVHCPATCNFPEPELTIEIPKDDILSYYRQMCMIRRTELLSNQLYTNGKIRGFCHLYNGQEAICVGMQASLTNKDGLITAYRDHGWHMVRGGTALEVFAEQMGTVEGCSKGKGGSMHLYKTDANYYGGNGIVGAQVPVGAGLAFKYAYRNKNSPEAVSVALYGDGAANQGQIFEAFNMSALWKLPCIFTCENNLYGMGTSAKRAAANTEFYKRCEYMPGVRVDGQDLIAVIQATKKAKEYCMGGNGPMILEMLSYRYGGHSMSDPGMGYRTKDEVTKMKTNFDPLTNLRKRCAGMIEEVEFERVLKEANKEVNEALKTAESSAVPGMEEIHTHIYDKMDYEVRGVDHTKPYYTPA